ncbi:MAG: LysR family transcriptional regulator [Pigmentiphaga sp.]|uniref:LysR family transcriptional regulator n=1 Tax=Pigmentiphaga sp. TaxID=1977564 RepID=UPI0029A57C5B|nr:LysR family transcriptional regulator [Pigmentiphaga sp.]MDX3905225.1 LysR family transcriptional regulator [Pigmentiphaga sp.]
MNISLRQLRAFLGVAASGNFTRTAQRLHLSQAGLSATIRELESQLNTRLFERTTRAVVLTEAGKAFLPSAELVERELTAAAARLKEMGRQEGTALRLAFTPLMAANVVPETLKRFHAECPGVDVEIIAGSPLEIQQLAETGEIDAAFGAFFTKVSGLVRKPLASSGLLAVYAPSRFSPVPSAPGEDDTTWEILRGQPYVALTGDSPIQQLAEEALFKYQVDIGARMAVQHLDTALGMAEQGFGIAIVPAFSQSACARYAVELRRISPAVKFDFSYVMRTGAPVPQTLARFAAIFKAVMEQD